MIKFTKYIKKKEELNLEYDEKFEIQEKEYMITQENCLYVWFIDMWRLSDNDIQWVCENKDLIIKQPQNPFWAEQDEKYYYITQDGKITVDVFVNGCLSDVFKRKLGNCYKTDRITKEQINEYLNKLNNKEIL